QFCCGLMCFVLFFFFSSRRRHTRFSRDWSSDVCSSDLYEKMTGDTQFNGYMHAQRDWLFGRNPWGTSMFTGMPEHGEFPEEVHTAPYVLLGMDIAGGLVDGPVYTSIYNNLLGLHLLQPDEFEHLQNNHVTYHDDVGDYSTNEPTMDGTAGAILMMAHFAGNVE